MTEMTERIFLLKELYCALWVSADFESDLEAKFPEDVYKLRNCNDTALSDDIILKMYNFMRRHPVFN